MQPTTSTRRLSALSRACLLCLLLGVLVMHGVTIHGPEHTAMAADGTATAMAAPHAHRVAPALAHAGATEEHSSDTCLATIRPGSAAAAAADRAAPELSDHGRPPSVPSLEAPLPDPALETLCVMRR